MFTDTIAAISTPLGEGGVAVVRLSGPAALRIADDCFLPVGSSSVSPSKAVSHSVQYGRIHRQGRALDEVLLSIFRAPRTFTREDLVEIGCHGGILPARLVLEALLAAGARLAEPGEFTKRAFLNGRIDLAQAEAVADVIHARTDLALRVAQEQLQGRLSRRIEGLRDALMQVLAHFEAHIDFPDEDIRPDTREVLLDKLRAGIGLADELLRTASDGQIVRHGVRTVIIGRPNAGKSSLLNALLGKDRAIVSPIPGTTRDTIEEMASIRGIPIIFIDTAGLREAKDVIEAEGIRRSEESLRRAGLVLHVIDGSEPLDPEDLGRLEQMANRKRVVVLNKADRPVQVQEVDIPIGLCAVSVSCLDGRGIETLKDAIRAQVWSGAEAAGTDEILISARHAEALSRARRHLALAMDSFAGGAGLELAAMDLRLATGAIGEIVGKTTTEDLLDSIFGQFCIGK